MLHKGWNIIQVVPYCSSRASVKLQGHAAKKNRQFGTKLGVSGLSLQFEFTDGFEMMYKAWCSIEDVPFCYPGSSIKFQGHTGWKIGNLNPIWVRLLGPSQLSNPSDLPCCMKGSQKAIHKGSLLWVHSVISIPHFISVRAYIMSVKINRVMRRFVSKSSWA